MAAASEAFLDRPRTLLDVAGPNGAT